MLGFGWGVAGVAAATAIADAVAMIFGVFLALPILRQLGGAFVGNKIIEGAKVRRVLALNLDIFIRTICVVFAFAYFTAQGAVFGNIVLAANAVLLNFQTFMAHALDGFAHSAEAMGGKAVGARDRIAFRHAVLVSMFWGMIIAIGFALLYLVAGSAIVSMLTGIKEVQTTAVHYIAWSVAMPLVAVFPFVFDGVFLGATRGRTMRNAMIVSVAVYIACCFTFVPFLGNHGLWAALLIFMGIRGITLGARYPALERSIGRT